MTQSKLRLYNTMIGRVYPFFLGNERALDTYYLYQLLSPGLTKNLAPLMTLQKVCEKTGKNDFCASETAWNHGDVLATLLRTRSGLEKRALDYIYGNLMQRGDGQSYGRAKFYKNGTDFPMWELEATNAIPKVLVTGMRSNLRFSRYKFAPGNKIDILLSPTQFGIFKIEGDRDKLWIKPEAVYENSDVSMKHPLKVDLNKINYPTQTWSGKSKVSDMNRAIYAWDWKSFDNQVIKEGE